MKKALILNHDFQPIQFTTNIRAMKLVCSGKAEIINVSGKPSTWEDFYYRTINAKYEAPATVRLLHKVVNPKKKSAPRFRKRAVFNRDGWLCQYCNEQLTSSNATIDHILPRSKGGMTSWKNCVTACKPCNKKKADKGLHEVGMKLLSAPSVPRNLNYWEAITEKSTAWHSDWSIFVSY
jgi:5-methylcytosine-specific restriction endonuclease McrA